MIMQILPGTADTYSGTYQVFSEEKETPVYHTVRFTADGETVSTVFVDDGGTIQDLPEAPAVEGKAFVGWFDGDAEFTAESVIYADKEITAVYTEELAAADYTFTSSTVYLKEIVSALGFTVENNSELSVDNSLIRLSDTTVKNKNMDSVTLTADGYFTLATLTIRKNDHIQTVTLAYPVPEENPDDPENPDNPDGDEDETLIEGALYANEHFYLTGKIPSKGVIDVTPVTVEIDGEEILAAYDIRIYANKKQKEKGKTWQPADKKVQVHWYDAAFENRELNVFHYNESAASPEHVSTVTAKDCWVAFEAASFSVYAVTETKLTQTVEASDGNTYEIEVTYQNTAGIPMEGTALLVSELKQDAADYDDYIAASAEKVGTTADQIEFSKIFDIRIVDEKNPETVYEPAGDVQVSIRLIGETLESYANLDVLHFVEGRTRKSTGYTVYDLDTAVEGETVQFTTDSFSVYVVIAHEGGTEIETPRVEFHFIDKSADEFVGNEGTTVYYMGNPYSFPNMHGNIQTSQILKDGEKLELIVDPDNQVNSYFYGWYVVNPYLIDGTTDEYGIGTANSKLYYTWPAYPSSISFDTPISISGSSTEIGETVTWSMNGVSGSGTLDSEGRIHVFLAPLYEKYHFINFMLQPKDLHLSGATNVMTRRMIPMGSADSIDIKISDVHSASTDSTHLIFTGWEYENSPNNWIQIQTIDYTGAELKQEGRDGTYLTVNATDITGGAGSHIDLYPIFVEARWVDFVSGASGSGSSFVGSRFLEAWGSATPEGTPEVNGKTVFTSLNVPTRNGYVFDGWYAYAKMNSTTSEITNLAEPEDVDVIYITRNDGNYTQHTATLNTRAVKITDGSGTVVYDGTSSIDEGGVTIPLFSGADGKLKFYDHLDRLKLTGKWIPAGSNITVVYWTENAENNDYTSSAVKTITTTQLNSQLGTDYASNSTLTLAGLGAYTDADFQTGIIDPLILDDVGAVPEGDAIFYDLNTDRSNASVVISGEGDTLFNVYFSRKVFTLVFHIGRDGYISTSGEQKKDNGNESWMQFFYNDIIATGFDGGTNTNGSSRGTSMIASAAMTYQGRTYTNEYVTNSANIRNSYIPGDGENVYVLRDKFGAYIGDRWPTPSNTAFHFTLTGQNKAMYTWSAYYGSLYCRIANERSATDFQNRHPDINGVYNYMTKELCADRDGTGLINAAQAHHFVAYFGDANKSGVDKTYHILYEAIDGTYDPEQWNERLVSGEDYQFYPRTAWTRDVAKADSAILQDRQFYPFSTHYPVISNLAPEYQMGWELDGYELIYSCFDTPEANKHHIYFFYRPRQYSLTFNFEDEADRKTDHYYYTESLANANLYEAKEKEGHRFLGWYTNEAGAGEPFGFETETMPSHNVVLYPVYEKLNYIIRIDPNGGEIGPGSPVQAGSTGFRADYKETISAYYYLQRNYIQTNAEEIAKIIELDNSFNPETDLYYYMNTQYISEEHDGRFIPANLRNALYLTQTGVADYFRDVYSAVPESDFAARGATKFTNLHDWMDAYFGGHDFNALPVYRRLRGAEKYSFMGWHQVHEGGTVDSAPFNFNTQVTEDIELRAMWRLEGGYLIQYNPFFFADNGDGTVTQVVGELEQWTDPENPALQLYADQSPTQILRAPTRVSQNWVFRGWRVVKAVGTQTYTEGGIVTEYPNWVPIQFDENDQVIYYQPGDNFTIDARLVSEMTEGGIGAIIHMQAYYEKEEDTSRRPKTANLTLDANPTYGGSVDSSLTLPPLPSSGTSGFDSGTPTSQILIGDFQSNIELHLKQYTEDQEFFKNTNQFMLIGFDEGSDPTLSYNEGQNETGLRTNKPYIPTFAPDSVIGVTRDELITLYAIWEPMVYVTFVNETGHDLHIDLNSTAETTISVVNQVTGKFDREQIVSSITVPIREQVKIVLPRAAADTDTITATAVNEHIRYRLSAEGIFQDNTYGDGSSGKLFGETADYTGVLQNNPTGIIVTYTEEPDPAVVFDVNGGEWTEQDSVFHTEDHLHYIFERDIQNRNNYKPSNPNRQNKVFLGWTIYPEIAEQTDFSSTSAVTWGELTITPDEGETILDKITDPDENYLWKVWAPDDSTSPPYDKTLYAVWSDTVTVNFVLTKSGSDLHSWTGPETTGTPGTDVFFREELSGRESSEVSYTMVKGAKLPQKPLDPTPFRPTSNKWIFMEWVTIPDFMGLTTGRTSIAPYIHDFDERVNENITLYTSWEAQANYQIYTFTVHNRVVDPIQEGESFTYTVSVEDVLLKSGSNIVRPSTAAQDVQTELEDGESYKFRLTIRREPSNGSHNWNGYDIFLEVFDKNHQPVGVGQHLLVNDNGNDSSDYQYTIRVSQAPKEGYSTDVSTDAGSIILELHGDAVTFLSKNGGAFTPNVNAFAGGENNYKHAEITFTNWRKADLTLTKNLTSDVGDSEQKFTFMLNSVVDEPSGRTYAYQKTRGGNVTGTGRLSTAEGSNTFTLRKDESICIGVPTGKKVSFTENNDHYTTVWTAEEGQPVDITDVSVSGGGSAAFSLSGDAAVTVTNTRVPQTVRVLKQVDSTTPDGNESFGFTALLMNESAPVMGFSVHSDEQHPDDSLVTDEDGQVHFSLHHNESIDLTIPQGVRLVVTEDMNVSYTPSAAMVDNNHNTIEDDDDAISSFTLNSVTQDGTITFTNTPRETQSVIFDVNEGEWQETDPRYTYLSGDWYEITREQIGENGYCPADPTREDKIFIGWTKNEALAAYTDFSGQDPLECGEITITPDAGKTVLDKVRSDYLWDFDQEPPYGEKLYAVWSEKVTVTFDLTMNGNYFHNWTGPEITQEERPYAFYRSSAESRTVLYSVAKGEKVPRPSNPTINAAWQKGVQEGFVFLEWLTDSGKKYTNTNPDAIKNSIFPFAEPVLNDVTVYTSWMAQKYIRHYTFTVQNQIDPNVDGEEFNYTFSLNSTMNSSGTYYESAPSSSPPGLSLKDNESFMIEITAVRYNASNWNHNSLYMIVTDRDGTVVYSGHMIVYQKNATTVEHETSDYQVTLTVTQTPKVDYTTTVTAPEGTTVDVGVQNYTFITGRYTTSSFPVSTEKDSFTFRSSNGNTAFVGTNKNNGIGTDYQDIAETIVFTNVKVGTAALTITKNVTGDMGDTTKAFTFHVQGLPDSSYPYRKLATTNGTDWSEVSGGEGMLSRTDNSFTLQHQQKIVIEGLPLGTELTISEEYGAYTTTWQLGDESPRTGDSLGFVLSADAMLNVTNHLPAVAPTGVGLRVAPYAMMLIMGAALAVTAVRTGKRKKRDEDQEE